ncbi:hypothetical protein NQZ68_018967 [Dissostichus eleginoides]|nr:hypothetical protein NQZ68_018967 [Dissostichus eleginoides]
MSVTVGEPREKQHLSGSVPRKESLKQGIQWPKTSATQRTVLLLWHSGDAVSKVPLTAKDQSNGFIQMMYTAGSLSGIEGFAVEPVTAGVSCVVGAVSTANQLLKKDPPWVAGPGTEVRGDLVCAVDFTEIQQSPKYRLR